MTIRNSNIQIFKENIQKRIHDKSKICIWLSSVIFSENKNQGDVNIILCDDDYLLDINQTYLKHNTLTDVISFDYGDGSIVSGDIYISLERVIENAKLFNVQIDNELKRVMVHGVLHLCGYKDKTEKDKKRMTQKEDFYLKQIIHST